MNCTNCGKEILNNAKFCDGCGSPIVSGQANAQPTYGRTAVANDAQENKVVYMLAYLGILFFLPLVSVPNSKIGRFHANQGLVLLITGIAGQIVFAILTAISWRLWSLVAVLSWLWGLALLALVIIGMMNANKGLQKPLPVIGKFMIIK